MRAAMTSQLHWGNVLTAQPNRSPCQNLWGPGIWLGRWATQLLSICVFSQVYRIF